MNNWSRLTFNTLAAAAVLLITGAISLVSAQQQYVISARAGLVNYTSGPVTYLTPSDPTWKEVSPQLQLKEGDRLNTEAWGKAEVLLNPGSYLRLGNAAEVVIRNTDLMETAFEVLSGSAILEVGQLQDGVITVQTPDTLVRIKKDGLYRIDAEPDATILTVRKGEAFFQTADRTFEKVKKNKRTWITAHDYDIARVDEDQLDAFDLWSADRAEILLAANQSFLRRYNGGPTLFQSVWIYDPFFGCYTFFPWGYAFRSIYGYGYFYPCPYYRYGYWSGGYHQTGGGGPGGGPNPPPSSNNPKTFSPREKNAGSIGIARDRGIRSTPTSRSLGGFPSAGSMDVYRGSRGSISGGGIRSGGGVSSGGIGSGSTGSVGGAKIGGPVNAGSRGKQ